MRTEQEIKDEIARLKKAIKQGTWGNPEAVWQRVYGLEWVLWQRPKMTIPRTKEVRA